MRKSRAKEVSTRFCAWCGEILPETMRSNAIYCSRLVRNCKSIERYYRLKDAGIHQSKDNNASKRRFLDAVKSYPCLDCGASWPACAMHLDHPDESIKVDDVSRMTKSAGWKRLIEEIMKCDLVCACCHAIRTEERGYQWELKIG